MRWAPPPTRASTPNTPPELFSRFSLTKSFLQTGIRPHGNRSNSEIRQSILSNFCVAWRTSAICTIRWVEAPFCEFRQCAVPRSTVPFPMTPLTSVCDATEDGKLFFTHDSHYAPWRLSQPFSQASKGKFFKKGNFQNGCAERLPPPPCWQSALSRRLSSLPRPIRRLQTIAGCRGRAATLLQRRRRVAVPKIMSSRSQVPRAALQPRSMSPSAKQSSADARALAGGPRRGVVATARLDVREASAITHDFFLAGRFGCSLRLRHACLLAN